MAAITLGQLYRVIRVPKAGDPAPAPESPVFNSTPTIDEGVGGPEVGILMTCSTPNVTPALAAIAYQWIRGASTEITGAESQTYLPTEDDIGETIKCEVTATIAGAAPTSVTTSATGAVQAADPELPPLGDAYDGVHADTLAFRNTVVSRFANAWEGYTGDGTDFDGEDRLCSSASTLATIWNEICALGQPDRMHRIRIGGSDANWTTQVTLRGSRLSENLAVHEQGHLFGGDKDFYHHGGLVLIEPNDPESVPLITQKWILSGVRGLHVRGLTFARQELAAGESSPLHISLSTSVWGTTGQDSKYPEPYVVRIEDCRIGTLYNPANTDETRYSKGIDGSGPGLDLAVVNCEFYGTDGGIGGNGCIYTRVFGCDFQKNIGDIRSFYNKYLTAAWDDTRPNESYYWMKGNTARNLVDNPRFAHLHSDVIQHGTGDDEQSYLSLVEFETAQMSHANSYHDFVLIRLPSNPADGDTLTVDGVVYTWRTTPTLATDIPRSTTSLSGSTGTLAKTRDYFNSISVTENGLIFCLAATSQGYFELHYSGVLLPTVTSSLAITTELKRDAGGTQGVFNDNTDALLTQGSIQVPGQINQVVINCLLATMGNAITMYLGTSIADRCSFVRCHENTPSATVGVEGFDYPNDANPELYGAGQLASLAPVIDHTIRNSVISGFKGTLAGISGASTAGEDGTYTVTLNSGVTAYLRAINNRYPTWFKNAVTDRADDMLAMPSAGTDAENRITYTIQNDGLNSQAAFRAAMYAQLKLADVDDRAAIGVTDPATWDV